MIRLFACLLINTCITWTSHLNSANSSIFNVSDLYVKYSICTLYVVVVILMVKYDVPNNHVTNPTIILSILLKSLHHNLFISCLLRVFGLIITRSIYHCFISLLLKWSVIIDILPLCFIMTRWICFWFLYLFIKMKVRIKITPYSTILNRITCNHYLLKWNDTFQHNITSYSLC